MKKLNQLNTKNNHLLALLILIAAFIFPFILQPIICLALIALIYLFAISLLTKAEKIVIWTTSILFVLFYLPVIRLSSIGLYFDRQIAPSVGILSCIVFLTLILSISLTSRLSKTND